MFQECVSDVRGRVWSLEHVATLPSTLVRILSIIQDESTTALDLADEISHDPALALKVLGAVNSSYYGFHRQISTISDAVVILGFEEVERLSLAISVINIFDRDRDNSRALHMLWRHSMACSVAASGIEAHYRTRKPGVNGAHVAALLHDIGKAVIVQYFPEAVRPILRLVQEDGLPVCEAEREILEGCTHCDIGAWIADRWGLPPCLVEAIAMHHAPELVPPDHLLTHITHAANTMCNIAGIRSLNVNTASEMDPRTATILPIDEMLQNHIIARLERQRGLISAMAAGSVY
ncbi:MAG: HDOD domain-containing protein [Candidatus Hydrogenedentes bacterium]|nr:HDOD domain-containing protein [Candidatus Hydrogenedentota bacterium]